MNESLNTARGDDSRPSSLIGYNLRLNPIKKCALQGSYDLAFIDPELISDATDIIMNSERESNRR
jgi:hypothetical protein